MRSVTKSAPKAGVPKNQPGQIVGPEQVRTWVEDGKPLAIVDAIVTPEIAELLLRYNKPGETNRPISRANVEQGKRMVQAGHWLNTGEPVIMSDEAILNDGQHRLIQVVESGVPLIMDLRFGVQRRAFHSTNSGRKRQPGDVLKLMGVNSYTGTAATARLLIAYNDGLPAALNNRYSNSEIAAAVERWPLIAEAVPFSGRFAPLFKVTPVFLVAFFAISTASQDSVVEFFDILRTGAGKVENPAHRFREYLIRNPSGNSGRLRVNSLAAGIIAWNAWRSPAGSVGSLRWRNHHPFPEVDGLVL